MRRFLLTLSCSLALAAFAPGPALSSWGRCEPVPVGTVQTYSSREALSLEEVQVPIALENRVKNNDGSCVICSLQTLGLHHNIKGMTDLMRRYRGGQTAETTNTIMTRIEVKYYIRGHGTPDYQSLKNACTNRWGAAIGVEGGQHMITLVHWDPEDQFVGVIDNNRVEVIQKWPMAEFKRRHDGFFVVVEPVAEKCPPKKDDNKVPVPIRPSHEVIALQEEVKKLKEELAALKDRPGTPGPAGPAGPQGPAGPPGASPDLTAILAEIKTLYAQQLELAKGLAEVKTKPTVDPAEVSKLRADIEALKAAFASIKFEDRFIVNPK